MDTSALNASFSEFSSDFSKFATDLAAYIKNNVPQDTPQQVADVAAVVTGLGAFDATVKDLESKINPPAAPPAAPAA